MITNIINPLLQAISFISIWYLYQIMSKVKPLPGHLFLIFISLRCWGILLQPCPKSL